MKKKLTPMGMFESIFDAVYLLFDVIAGCIFLSRGMYVWMLLAWELGAGDAFLLVPRVQRHLKGEEKNTERNLGLGLFVSSITMTIYYLVLLAIYESMFGSVNMVIKVCIYVFAMIRILICLSPQNNWFKYEGNVKWGIYRNLPFAILGFLMIYVFMTTGTSFGIQMGIAIIVSYACYIPVTLYAKKIPAIGSLMMPKTLAYVWMLILGLCL